MEELLAELEALPRDDNFRFALEDLIEAWRGRGVELDGVEAALAFIEQNPDLDYGAPGPIVHFAETFYRKGYEPALLRSFAQRPTVLTAWMMNRLINGTQDPATRDGYLAALRRAADDPATDEATRAEVRHFLDING